MDLPLLDPGRDDPQCDQFRHGRDPQRPGEALRGPEHHLVLGYSHPSIAIGVRRLHDTNHTGWWLLISLIPVIGWIWVLVYLVQDSDENAWQSYDKEPLPVTE